MTLKLRARCHPESCDTRGSGRYARQNTFLIPLDYVFETVDRRPVLDRQRLRRIVKTFTAAGLHCIEGGHIGCRPKGDWKSTRLEIQLTRNAETQQILLSGLGQVHIEVTVEKLKRKFNVEVLLDTPKIPYKETITKKVRVQGKHKKQTGGHGQYGDCWVEVEPLPRGKGFEFVDKIVGGVIPKQYIPAVEKGIVDSSQKGVLAGFPCVDFRATLDYGSYHSVDSSEMAFKVAGSLAFKKASADAGPVLLEPIMNVSIITPDEYMGDIMGDLNSRRGRVLGMDSKGKNQVINAQVPMAEFLTYAPDLRSITGGRGMFSMEFSHYDEVPVQISQKIIEEINRDKE